jgi:hypothetical protein
MDKLVRFVRHHHLVQLYADVRTAAAAACGVGLLLLACYGVGGNQGREPKIGKEEEGEWLWGSQIYLQFSDIHFGVLLLWCLFGFSRLLIFPTFVLMHFLFSVSGKEKQVSNDGVFHLNHIQVLPYLSTRGRQSCNQF